MRAYKNYKQVLKFDPNNKTAISQIKKIERIIGTPPATEAS